MQVLELRPGTLLEPVGTQWAAFSAASGRTLLLNDTAAAFLEVLSESAMTLDAAGALIAADSGQPAGELLPMLDDTATLLEAGGLIRRRPAADPAPADARPA